MKSEIAKLKQLTEALTSNGYLMDQTNAWKYAFDAVSELVCVTNTHLILKFMNRSMSQRLDISSDDYLNRKLNDFFTYKLGTLSICSTDEKIKPLICRECYIEALNGWFDLKRYCVKDDDKNHIGYTFILSDITEKLKHQNKIKEINKTLEGVLNIIPDLITVQDTDKNILMSNDAVHKLLGDRELNTKCYDLLGRSFSCETCQTDVCKKTKKPEQLERYIEELKGWYDCRSYPILNKKGEVEKVVEHLRDITKIKIKQSQEKKYKEALDKTCRDLNYIISTVNGYIWQKEFKPSICDDSFVYTYIDPTLCKDFYGIHCADSKDTYYNHTTMELLSEVNRRHTFGKICDVTDAHCVEQGTPCEYIEMGYIEKPGEGDQWIITRTRKTPILDEEEGIFTKILGFGNDCSDNAIMIKKYIERGIEIGLIKRLEGSTEETKAYWIIGKGLDDRELNHTDFI